MCLRQIFHGHRIFKHFYNVTSIKSINIVFETGEYHSWSNTLMRTPKKTMRGVINAKIKIDKGLIRHVHMHTLFWFHKKSTDLQREVKANLHLLFELWDIESWPPLRIPYTGLQSDQLLLYCYNQDTPLCSVPMSGSQASQQRVHAWSELPTPEK